MRRACSCAYTATLTHTCRAASPMSQILDLVFVYVTAFSLQQLVQFIESEDAVVSSWPGLYWAGILFGCKIAQTIIDAQSSIARTYIRMDVSLRQSLPPLSSPSNHP